MAGTDRTERPSGEHASTSATQSEASGWRFAETQESLVSVDQFLSRSCTALTILCHPDVRRIGDVARLATLDSGNVVNLSRLEPIFLTPGYSEGEVLADPRISRRPVRLKQVKTGGIEVDLSGTSTQMLIDGLPTSQHHVLSAKEVQRGVVFQLGRYFTFWLHNIGPASPPAPPFGMVGANAAIEKVRGDVVRVADIDVPVLIRGESGTGKELLAHAIHNASHRKARPFVALNMAAITTSTAASELFGHVRGAFTGAARDHEGLFMRANGGTLFLDEVGETPAELQAMLLRVLETGEIQPVGATRTRKTNVRLVAATDADLESATQKGRFKLPLLHRLSGYELRLPPLRDRIDDIARLFVYFFQIELEAVGEPQRLKPNDARAVIPAGLMARMCCYDWPGNVRQLRNVVRQLVISSRGSDDLVVDASVERLLAGMQSSQSAEHEPPRMKPTKKRPAEITDDELLEALRRHEFQPGPVAREFGMSRTTLYARIEKSSRIRKAGDLSREEIQMAMSAAVDDLAAAARMLEVSKRGLRLRLTELDG